MQVYNSDLYGYIKNYKLICLMCLMLFSISCANTESYKDTEEYSFKPLTLKLIEELGGVDELSKYQFYLSNSFELLRVENEKSLTDKGYVNNLDNNYRIIFDNHTPGIFRRANMRAYGKIDGIDILFDEADNDYLTFKIEKEPYDRNTAKFYHANGTNNEYVGSTIERYPSFKRVGNVFHSYNSSNTYKYKDLAWNKMTILSRKEKRDSKYYLGETYLIIRIKNLSTTTTDKAKGRTLSE